MIFKDGVEAEKLKTIASAKKFLKQGKTILVYCQIGDDWCALYFYRKICNSLEQLIEAKKESTGRKISNYADRSKPSYFLLTKGLENEPTAIIE